MQSFIPKDWFLLDNAVARVVMARFGDKIIALSEDEQQALGVDYERIADV